MRHSWKLKAMNLFDAKPSYEELEARVVELEQEVAELRKVKPKGSTRRFPDFWMAYPNKKGKAEAEKRWKADRLDEIADTIIQHVYLMIAEDDGWQRGYAPMGSTYLNQKRWTDVPQGAPLAARAQPSKQMQALMKMGGMNGLDRTGTQARIDAANVHRPALGTSSGYDARHSNGMERRYPSQPGMGQCDGWPAIPGGFLESDG